MAKRIPNGNHMNIYRVAEGVGRNASLPSWNIRGFGYLSLGNTELGLPLPSSLFTTYASCHYHVAEIRHNTLIDLIKLCLLITI